MAKNPIISEERRNQLIANLQSTTSLQPLAGYISSPRLQMFNGHLTQALGIRGRTSRRLFSGLESKFGEYTFGVKFKHDSKILKSVIRYPKTIGSDSINESPETVHIFEFEDDANNGALFIDCISQPSHHELHQQFGYKYVPKDMVQEYMPAGSIVAQSPSISPDGDYQYGLEAEVALMSDPAIVEDGIVISESFAKRLTTTSIESFTISWGKKEYPLNVYGDDGRYKIHPDIGDVIRDDGILLALRKFNDSIAPITMNKKALQKPDFVYDKCIYSAAGGKVIDVRVHHDLRLRGAIRGKTLNTPVGMDVQSEKYLQADRIFYQSILTEYRRLVATRKDNLNITPRFQRLIVDAMAACTDVEKQRTIRTFRGVPIDEWRVTITVEHEIVPTIGYKVTGCQGDVHKITG